MKLDDEMTSAYTKNRASLGGKELKTFVASQREWIKKRNQYCLANSQCLEEFMSKRIHEISQVAGVNIHELSASAPGLDVHPEFLSKWTSISNACIPDSFLIIKKNQFSYQGVNDAKTRTFKVVKSSPTYQVLEITSELKCEASCESRYYEIRTAGKNQIKFTEGDKLNAEGLTGSSCWYSKRDGKN